MSRKKIKHVHFMGVGGSALSGVAAIARRIGFDVSGCDIEKDTDYIKEVKKNNIRVFHKHNKKHLEHVDLLAVSPAIYFQNKKHPEFIEGKKKGIVLSWDKFVGDYLLENMDVICITGTHGKSSTTALTARVFEEAGLDPSVLIGAKVKDWQKNYRVGEGEFFIIEADDFFEKFLNYKPSTIILNNIEYDHPDFFSSEKSMLKSYYNFIKLLQDKKILIINLDSEGNRKLLKILGKKFLKKIKVFGYTLSQTPSAKIDNIVYAYITEKRPSYSKFTVYSKKLDIDDVFKINLPGEYNISNSLGVIILSSIYKINLDLVKDVFLSFGGTSRRMQLIGEKKGIKVFDDYAHHPTAISKTLSGLRQKFPNRRIWVVDEPHSFSRTKALLKDYKGVFDSADKVIIGPIYKARDNRKYGVSSKSIVQASEHNDIKAVNNLAAIISTIKKDIKKKDVIIVMGAGKSYLWARKILQSL